MRSDFRTIAGRRVVLKPLVDDCLLDGELHPSIRLRLCRIRELPMTSVANLHGVERIDSGAFSIWDYVEGRTLDELPPPDRAALEREVRLVVDTLHSHGIVHGALHARNIIIDERNRVHLTHLSPLLHNDIDKDFAALDTIFTSSINARRGQAQRRPGPFASSSTDRRLNPRALLSAAAVLIIGLLITLSILYLTTQPS